MKSDLFPETLLVNVADGHTFTTSLMVADHFHKHHKNVLRAIESLIADCPDQAFGRLNFEPSSYLNAQSKPQPLYRLTHNGFALLAMGFTGAEAMGWKIAFLRAFNAMEAQLRAHTEREAAALHLLRPVTVAVAEQTEAGLNRSAIGFEVDRSPNSISYHRRSARRLGLLPQRAA